MKKKLVELRGWMEKREYDVSVSMKEGGSVAVWDSKGEETRRELKDRKINRKERKLIEFIEEREWTILNREVGGDDKREWMYTEEGRSQR